MRGNKNMVDIPKARDSTQPVVIPSSEHISIKYDDVRFNANCVPLFKLFMTLPRYLHLHLFIRV